MQIDLLPAGLQELQRLLTPYQLKIVKIDEEEFPDQVVVKMQNLREDAEATKTRYLSVLLPNEDATQSSPGTAKLAMECVKEMTDARYRAIDGDRANKLRSALRLHGASVPDAVVKQVTGVSADELTAVKARLKARRAVKAQLGVV